MNNKRATEQERELHSLIVQGDDVALSKLYDLHGESVIKALKRWYHSVKDEVIILQAVNEALLGYYRNPRTYDPDKNTLQRFLEIAAERDLKNLLQKEKKHKNLYEPVEDVELDAKSRNRVRKDMSTTDDLLVLDQSLSEVDMELSKHFKTNEDISMAKLILSGERDTEAFVEVLELNELNQSERQKEVKRNKDRIKKVLERNQVEEKIRALLNG